MSGEKTWQVRAGLHYRSLADGGMLYDEKVGKVHHFNATAALVWEACQCGQSTRQIVAGLCIRFAVEEDEVGKDVKDILAEFGESELVL